MKTTQITNEFIINYLVELSNSERVNLLKKVTEKLCQFNIPDIDAVSAVSAVSADVPTTPEPKNEPKIEPNAPEPKDEPKPVIIQEEERKIEAPSIIPVTQTGLDIYLRQRNSIMLSVIHKAIHNNNLGLHLILEVTDYSIKIISKDSGAITNINCIGTNDWESYNIHTTNMLRKEWRNFMNETLTFVDGLAKVICVNHPGIDYFNVKKLNIKYALLDDGSKIEILDLIPYFAQPREQFQYDIIYRVKTDNVKYYKELLTSYINFELKPQQTCPCCLETTNVYIDKCKHPLCVECFNNIRKYPGKYYKSCPLCRDDIKNISKMFVKRR